MKKTILITLGDPGGVGAEVALKAFTSEKISGAKRIVFIGDTLLLREAAKMLSCDFEIREINSISEAEFEGNIVNIINLRILRSLEKCRSTAEGGMASAEYIKKAVQIILNKDADALVTAPISKDAFKKAGVKWPGHTEMLAELTDTRDFAMMLCGGRLKVVLVTIHVKLKDVPGLIKKEKVLRTIRLAHKAAAMLGIAQPRIAVSGLNPHAGETGIFGDEEVLEILPAIENAKDDGLPVEGPFPPDTLFYKAYKGEFDMIIAMYHDQGLIPLKMIAFEKGVNVTVGLPIIRTSPDHGTAYDIAWKGIADPSSMIEAIKMAEKLRL